MRGWGVAPGLVASVLLLFVPGLAGPVAGLVVALCVALAWDPAVLRSGLRIGLLLALLFAAAAAGALVTVSGGPDRGMAAAAGLLIRFSVVWITAGIVARSLSGETVIQWSRRVGIGPLGDSVALALNVFPVLVVRARDAVAASRQRGLPWWRGWVESFEVLLAHTARLADRAAAAAALRGHAGLGRRRFEPQTGRAPVVVVTGRPGVGKTPVVTAAVELLSEDGVGVFGIIQPGVFAGSEKVGFAIRDLLSGREAPLADRVARDSGEYGTRFRFDPKGAELARRALAEPAPNHVLVIDELGPVELRGGGHAELVTRRLADPDLPCAVLVVRRHLVPALLEAFAILDAEILDVEAVDEPAERIRRLVRAALG